MARTAYNLVDKKALNNAWLTPARALRAVRAYAPIGLDPCTEPDNPVNAEEFYTEVQNGLRRPWGGRGLVFVNPPYSTLPPTSPDASPEEVREGKRQYMRRLKDVGAEVFGLERKRVTSLIVLWAAKIHREATKGTELIALLPCGARFGTDYWQSMILTEHLDAVCFVRGRLSFIDASTRRPGKGNNYDSMFYGYNVRRRAFTKAFAPLGACFSTRRRG